MAGDWIKMRGNLWDDPRVAKLCDLTGQSEAAIIGGLYWLWATADQHTEDGCMPGLTLRQIDRKTGIQGFGAGLCAIGWLRDDEQGVVLAKFEEHNGTSAKRRCTDAQRKANSRNVSASYADIPPTAYGQEAPSLGAREEKRREEKDLGRATSGSAPEVDTEGFTPTPAGAACIAMRKAGMQAVNPGDPRLLALLAQGATPEELAGVAADAVAKGKGFAWALKALEGRRADAQAIALAPMAVKSANSAAMAEETARETARQDAQARKLADPEEQARIAAIRERARRALKVVA